MHSLVWSTNQFPVLLTGFRVLVVEDDSDTRAMYMLVLGQRGAVVTSVGSACDAIDALDRIRFDAIVSDIGLPDQSGYALIEQVRSRAPKLGQTTPAVAVTAYSDPESRARARAVGFQAFILKPVEIDELAGVIAMLARPVAESRRRLNELTARADLQPPLLSRLDALLKDREWTQAERRRLSIEAHRLRAPMSH